MGLTMRKKMRDCFVQSFVLLPLSLKVLLLRTFRRCILWTLFHLEHETVTIAPVGPRFWRYHMWLNWQGHTDYILGVYEPWTFEVLRHYLKPGYCCIDVGAHLGYFTIFMASLVGHNGLVVAFEPFPENFSILKENIQLNKLPNVKLEPIALSDQESSLPLIFGDHEQLSWTPSTSGYAVEGQQKSISVPARSLDDYLSKSIDITNIDFIKIDVEGAELGVLHGSCETLKRVRPILLIEIHGADTTQSTEILHFLAEFDYQIKIVAHRNHEAFCLATPNGS